ncbi:MAG: Polysaccharide deacetylase [Deltaproteobacteria bacterium]|nr:Polysaccharide deacetylase [Deltaproteobacteria bacterium]
MKEKPRIVLWSGLIFLVLVLDGWFVISSGFTQTIRTFPDFLAVVAGEGDTFSSLSQKYLNDPTRDWSLAEWNEPGPLKPGQTVIIPLKLKQKGGLSLQGYQTVPVLTYHNISSDKSDKMTVKQEMFEQQMSYLREKGYRVIAIDQFFDFLDFKTPIPPKSVVITIDDGWLSAYEIVFPILKRYGYPATLFIYTDIIGRSSKAVSWNQLQEMAAQGIEIGGHSMSHRSLTLPGKKESFKEYFDNLEKELSGSREMIKKKLNREVKYLAYPYGDTTSLVVELAKKLGYRGALTIKREGNPFFVHNYRVNRSVIYGDFSLSHFERSLAVFQEQSLK